jgi:hypothetical protein
LTRISGSAAYTIPKVDVLVATVFQSLPGPEITATLTYSKDQIIWDPASASRANVPCPVATNGSGCLNSGATTVAVPLFLSNEIFGERTTFFDLKLAKNIRFSNKRATVGVDVYNLFNSDAIQSYNGTYTAWRDAGGVWHEGDNRPRQTWRCRTGRSR